MDTVTYDGSADGKQKRNLLPQRVRDAESEIDTAYRYNTLLSLRFAEAAWNVLGVTEDLVFIPKTSGDLSRQHETEALLDNLKYVLKHCLNWLISSCQPQGTVPSSFNDDHYQAAGNLAKLAFNYASFVTVFTYASSGLIKLDVDDRKLVFDKLDWDMRYEAYDRLIRPPRRETLIARIDQEAFVELQELVAYSLQIRGENFAVKLNSKMVELARDFYQVSIAEAFQLPDNWSFSRYTLGEFKRVYGSVAAIANIQYLARILAARRGIPGMGYANAIFLTTRPDLERRIVRYSGLPHEKVSNVLLDVTFGHYDFKLPDPALQPLIPLNDQILAVAPTLWISSSAERNLMALLNRIPSERLIYSKLSNDKEGLMKQRLESASVVAAYRTRSGAIPGDRPLPDVDLAIISDAERSCLVLELKWFLDPGEPREIIEKSGEIANGISQLQILKSAFLENYTPLLNFLSIGSDYTMGFAVLSANSIGMPYVQHPEIPVVRESTFVQKLSAVTALSDLIQWLEKREYLPVEEKDFTVDWYESSVGGWALKWFAINPLIEGPFIPN